MLTGVPRVFVSSFEMLAVLRGELVEVSPTDSSQCHQDTELGPAVTLVTGKSQQQYLEVMELAAGGVSSRIQSAFNCCLIQAHT